MASEGVLVPRAGALRLHGSSRRRSLRRGEAGASAGDTPSMPAPLIEFPADDPDRARRFWHGVLGVTLAPRPAAAGAGWQTDTDGLRLGVHARGLGPGDTASLPYFTVADLATTLERVRDLGGSIIHPGDRWAVPGLRRQPLRASRHAHSRGLAPTRCSRKADVAVRRCRLLPCMESASGQLAASMRFIARYGDGGRFSAASMRSSRLSSRRICSAVAVSAPVGVPSPRARDTKVLVIEAVMTVRKASATSMTSTARSRPATSGNVVAVPNGRDGLDRPPEPRSG